MQTSNPVKSYYKRAFSNELAVGSFAIGTLLFLTYKIMPHEAIVFVIGLFYVISAFAVNIIMLLYLLFLCTILPDERKKLQQKIILLICNIPIAILYFYFII